MTYDEFAPARQRTDAEHDAVTAKLVDRAQRRSVLNRLRPATDPNLQARADATVAHFRATQDGGDDATG